MRLPLDEKIPRTVIEKLRECGDDVLSVKEALRSQPDHEILARAQAEKRLVVTHDKDFGTRAFHSRLPVDSGVILLRLTGVDPDSCNRRILEALSSRRDWAGHFSVVTDTSIRMRPLPGP